MYRDKAEKQFGLVFIVKSNDTGLWTWMHDCHETLICYIKLGLDYDMMDDEFEKDATNAYDWAIVENEAILLRHEAGDELTREDLYCEWTSLYNDGVACHENC